MAVPGLKKDDFNIELENDVLTISSEKERKTESKEDKYVRREFQYSSFKRTFSLPENVVNGDMVRQIIRMEFCIFYFQKKKK